VSVRFPASCGDPATGIVYQTEGTGDSLFYRYIPHSRGELLLGGKLQELKLKGYSGGVDTTTGFIGQLNKPMAVQWVDITNPDPSDNSFANSTRGQSAAATSGPARYGPMTPVRGSNGNDIVGVNSDGQLFRVAENVINDSEFCGGCFSHDGRFMFVNIQNPGLTLVIEGPWRKGQR
jgi:secreted PhoX family phosphatase